MADTLESLTQRLRLLGAPDPEAWATSELEGSIPQTARYVALRRLWPEIIHPWRDPDVLRRVPATRRLIDAGVDPSAVSSAMCLAAYEAVFETLYLLTADAEDLGDDVPRACLVEHDASGHPTGRHVEALHEDLLGLDPSGREGADFL